MIPQPYLRFASPVTLRLSLPTSRTARQSATVERTFPGLSFHVQIDPIRREARAYLPPIPGSILLYSPVDFSAACPDSMDDHAERVLQLLGSDPAPALQALIDGTPLPDPPPWVPREVAHWRIEYMLAKSGKLEILEAMIASLPESARFIADAAWRGKSAIARRSPLVLAAAELLNYSDAEMDALFISAAAIPA
jgi:hypothetical protein